MTIKCSDTNFTILPLFQNKSVSKKEERKECGSGKVDVQCVRLNADLASRSIRNRVLQIEALDRKDIEEASIMIPATIPIILKLLK